MTQQNPLIEIDQTYITYESPATNLQARLVVEAIEVWLRQQGQTDAADLLKTQL